MFIEVHGLSRKYQTGEIATVALDDVSLSLEKGKTAVILGPSGSGKSTFMNILGGIDRADKGSVKINGVEIADFSDDELTEYRRENVGFIFQSYNLIPHLTVAENIEVIQHISKNPLSVQEILEAVGLLDKRDRFPSEISGGEQQRVAVARAIIKNPDLLLCDELTGALDYTSAISVLSLVQTIGKRFGTTILIVTHNAAIAKMADKVWKFRSGVVTDTLVNDHPFDARRIEW